MNLTANKACAWTGAVLVLGFLIGFWVIAGFVPPPAPDDSAQETADFFADNTTSIRIGMIVSSLAAMCMLPWAAAISTQLRRIEGPHGVWANIQLVSAGLSVLVFEYILFFWITATYREDRSAEIVQTINDLAWLPFVGIVGTAALQAIVIALAVLGDRREQPILPRWVGYANLWAALLFFPGTVASFFKDGPLAWNGVLTWYTVLTVFCAWIVLNTVVVLQAIRRQEREPAPPPADDVAALAAEVAALRAELDRATAGVR